MTQTDRAAYAAPPQSLPRRLRGVLSLHDFEALARAHLPRPVFGYVAGAAEDNRTLAANRAAFEAVRFRSRVLVDVSARDTGVTLFGQRYAAPFGIAPLGLAALAAYRGDLVLARAAQAKGVPFVMSGSSLVPMEAVAEAAPGSWFQAYLPGDPQRIDALVDRVQAAGFPVLVLTVDIPVWANRENLVRVGFSTPLRPSLRLALDGLLRPRWLVGTFCRTLLAHGMPHFENSFAERGAPMLSARAVRDTTGRDHLDWAVVRRIRARWRGALVVKGILHPGDAALALQHGADGIVVSNHGGRQLDGAAASLAALPAVVDAVAGRIPVLLDSGVRRGTDVLAALAHGASACLVGRPMLYAAAVGGEAGVAHAIGLLRAEVDRNLAMLGLADLGGLRSRGVLHG